VRWASAVSDASDLETAIEAVSTRVLHELAGAGVDLAVVFVSHHHAARYTEVGSLLRQALPHRLLLGCSAGGVIGGGHEIEDRHGFALTVAALPDTVLTPFVMPADALPDADAPPRAWHAAVGAPPEPLPHFVLLADPLSCPIDHLLAGLDYAYPRSPKVGGLASGARRPEGNVLYCDTQVLRSGAVGLALSGNVRIETVVAQGCRPIGVPMQITHCESNILLELDGKSPLETIRDLVPQLDAADRTLLSQALFLGLVTDPLAEAPQRGDFLIRNIVGIDPQQGALAIGERLRVGQTVQFHLRDARTSAEDLALLLERFAASAPAAATRGALLFSCLGRGSYLYGRADHDTDLFRDRLGELPLGGFFCNGEIGPVSGATRVHGYTSSFGLFLPSQP
jgi:small ligand-binding sensory domain FIST